MVLSRRHFFLGSLALPALAAKKPAPERPNIVLMVADNVPQWVLGSYGNKEIRTPNLDRLAQIGTRFLNSSPPRPPPPRAAPACSPAALRCEPPQGRDTRKDACRRRATSALPPMRATAPRHIDAASPGKPILLPVNLTSPRRSVPRHRAEISRPVLADEVRHLQSRSRRR